jgi:hypothetical protein
MGVRICVGIIGQAASVIVTATAMRIRRMRVIVALFGRARDR